MVPLRDALLSGRVVRLLADPDRLDPVLAQDSMRPESSASRSGTMRRHPACGGLAPRRGASVPARRMPAHGPAPVPLLSGRVESVRENRIEAVRIREQAHDAA